MPTAGRLELTDGLARAAAAPTAARFNTVLLEIGPVSVARAGVEVGLGVVLGSLVLVADEQPDGRAKGDAVLCPGLEVDEVLFVSLWRRSGCYLHRRLSSAHKTTHGSSEVALTGPPPAQLHLDVLGGQREALGVSQQ